MRSIAFAVAILGTGPLLAAEIPSSVRIVAAEDRKACRYIGVISTAGRMGFNKPKIAMRKAFAEVEKAGGNGLFIVGQTSNWVEGATLTGEALDCPK